MQDREILEAEIHEAFREKLGYKSQKYDLLCRKFQTTFDQGDLDLSLSLLNALNKSISLLGKEFAKLIEIVFSFPWLSFADKRLHEAFEYFVTNVLSIHPFFTQIALKSIIEAFLLNDSSLSQIANFQPVHSLLLAIFKVVPSMTPFLLNSLREAFPHSSQSCECLKVFLENSLAISNYLPLVRNQILEICIEKLVEIDGETAVSDCAKIESCLGVLLEFLGNLHGNSQLQSAFYALLITFERAILRSFRLNYIQYYIYYICSLDSSFCEHFLGMLFNPFVADSSSASAVAGGHTADICLAMTANYISSFVARAAFLEETCVSWSFHILLDWMENYLATWDEISCAVGKHAVFYAVCQAILFIFIFRHRILLPESDPECWHKIQPLLSKLVNCSLNPLKVCNSDVVQEFARISAEYQLVYCFSVLERNKKVVGSLAQECVTFQELFQVFPFETVELENLQVFLPSSLFVQWESSQEDQTISSHEMLLLSSEGRSGCKTPPKSDEEQNDDKVAFQEDHSSFSVDLSIKRSSSYLLLNFHDEEVDEFVDF